MKIEIVIPTKARHEKLLKCLGSIEDAKKQINDNLYTYVYFSSEIEYKLLDKALKQYDWIFTRLLDKPYNASEFWNDHLKSHNGDLTYLINDDVIISPYLLKNSINNMLLHFPDLDGVVGIFQENIPLTQQCKAAFTLIGTKFKDRFPDKNIYCMDYKRFYLDQELYLYANSIEKFYFDQSSTLIHLHPNYSNYKADETHHNVRKFWKKDKETFDLRIKNNYLWGKDFKLIYE